MTKQTLILDIAQALDVTRNEAEEILDRILAAIVQALKTGDGVEIRGFGSFRLRHRNARTGRNPKTGARVEIPAKDVPYFRPSKELRAGLNPVPTDPATSR